MMEVSAVHQLANFTAAAAETSNSSAEPGNGAAFARVVEQFMSDVNTKQLEANVAVEQFVTGEARSVSEVMLAVSQADMSFRLMMEVRNRAIDTYQEIMRMPL